MPGEELLGDRQVDDRVAEELQALVMSGSVLGMLVVPAGMDEGLPKQAQVSDRKADMRGECVGGRHSVRSRPIAREAR
jgi:hypothetical protein